MEKYIIYKTTNLLNNFIYIGVHKQSSDKFDNYYGSSRSLSRDIKDYGSSNFIRETLFSYDTEEDAYKKEIELVNRDFCERRDTYNRALGGRGGKHFCYTEEDRILANIDATKTRIEKYGHPMGNAISEESRNKTLVTRHRINLEVYPELNIMCSLVSPKDEIIISGSLYEISFVLYGRRNAVKYRHIPSLALTHGNSMKNGKFRGYKIIPFNQESSTTSAEHVEDEYLRNRIYELKTHKDIVYSYKKL